jgi:phage terminase large subunit
VIQQLWVWAEELHQTPNELKNNLFKAVYSEGNTTTHHTVNTDNKQLLQSLLTVTKIKQLNPDDCSMLQSRFIGKNMAVGWGSAAKPTLV